MDPGSQFETLKNWDCDPIKCIHLSSSSFNRLKIPHCPFENGEQNYQTEQKFDWRVYSKNQILFDYFCYNSIWFKLMYLYQMEQKFAWKVHSRGADCLLQLQFHKLALVLRTTTLISKFSRNWENQLLFPLGNWFIFENEHREYVWNFTVATRASTQCGGLSSFNSIQRKSLSLNWVITLIAQHAIFQFSQVFSDEICTHTENFLIF